eukprot:412820_1
MVICVMELSRWALTLEDEDVLESTMFCGINYQHSCKGWKVDGIYYRCIDSQSACDYYRNGAQVDMREANIYTPLVVSSSYSPNTIIKCGLIDPTNPHEAYPERCSYIVNIFSQNGWSSVSWSYLDDRRWALTLEDEDVLESTMFCGINYQHSCKGWKVDGIYYRCIDSQSACDYYRNDTYTFSP